MRPIPTYTIQYVDGTVEISPSDGYGEYDPTAVATTISAASNGASVGAGTINVVSGGLAVGFTAYQNLTIQTTANGAQAVFCKGTDPTYFSVCTPNGATGTLATGGWVSSAPMHRFDAYTVSGGRTAVTPSSLTILNDVPAAGRGMASRITADATNGVITYVQSATPTGTLDLTYGICRTGTATYSASDANCATGVIHYNRGVTSNIGGDVTVLSVTNHTYQQIDTAVTAPGTVNPGQSFKVRVAPSPGAIPRAPALLGRRCDGQQLVEVRRRLSDPGRLHRRQPATDRRRRLHGGGHERRDRHGVHDVRVGLLRGVGAVGQLHPELPALHRRADAQLGEHAGRTSDDDADPGGHPPGHRCVGHGRQLQADRGAEHHQRATLIIGTTANFYGYPTNPPPFGNVTPPVGTPVNLSSTTIN